MTQKNGLYLEGSTLSGDMLKLTFKVTRIASGMALGDLLNNSLVLWQVDLYHPSVPRLNHAVWVVDSWNTTLDSFYCNVEVNFRQYFDDTSKSHVIRFQPVPIKNSNDTPVPEMQPSPASNEVHDRFRDVRRHFYSHGKAYWKLPCDKKTGFSVEKIIYDFDKMQIRFRIASNEALSRLVTILGSENTFNINAMNTGYPHYNRRWHCRGWKVLAQMGEDVREITAKFELSDKKLGPFPARDHIVLDPEPKPVWSDLSNVYKPQRPSPTKPEGKSVTQIKTSGVWVDIETARSNGIIVEGEPYPIRMSWDTSSKPPDVIGYVISSNSKYAPKTVTPEQKALMDMDFADVEARWMAHLAKWRDVLWPQIYGSVTGRINHKEPNYEDSVKGILQRRWAHKNPNPQHAPRPDVLSKIRGHEYQYIIFDEWVDKTLDIPAELKGKARELYILQLLGLDR